MAQQPAPPPTRYVGVIKRRGRNPKGVEYCIIEDLPGKRKRRNKPNGYFQLQFQPEDQQPIFQRGVRVSFEISPVSHKDNPDHTIEARNVRVAERVSGTATMEVHPPGTWKPRAARISSPTSDDIQLEDQYEPDYSDVGEPTPVPESSGILIEPLQEVDDGCIIVIGSRYDFVATGGKQGEKFTCTYGGRGNLLDTRTEAIIKEGGHSYVFEFGDEPRVEFTLKLKSTRGNISFAGESVEPTSYALRSGLTVEKGECHGDSN